MLLSDLISERLELQLRVELVKQKIKQAVKRMEENPCPYEDCCGCTGHDSDHRHSHCDECGRLDEKCRCDKRKKV